ncbi:glutamate--tRNA ligase family protein [Pontiella sulfatireligans]|uniref:Glutamate--tRNA ligase n=1 Tax=Pontiella sulfatireligans TaxID=2750658 RepID=A0A6C2UQC6_9BACT|nr:glutamate--tRNA ligase family protein [Pontiella sulfatireligans]VGO21507.1 Glutamate--tRNA ligase [Pontiella sulfatireligans]
MTTRFAPSLTGYLHLGHVLHMLYVWGIAKAKGAKVIARIEDHDRGRARPEYEQAIFENMEWLGFPPDLGINASTAAHPSNFRQSDCGNHYAEVLETLEKRGLVYGCECSRRQILEKQSDGQGELCYPGTCAEKNLPLEGNTVRFRIPSESVAFCDLALGDCHQAPVGQCGDFSLRDRTGQWTYQFCCVCDDIRHGIDLVIRGEDILSSTARQIQLFQALGAPVPAYFHHPLICDESGEKLSKRQRSESITQLRETGAIPKEIIGRAMFSGGLQSCEAPLELTDALALMGNI